jgi:hypothetical protein
MPLHGLRAQGLRWTALAALCAGIAVGDVERD